ncbi:MAG: carboxymuconolactone decarboxylase family protein [Polyangiales bacterium]
MENKHENKPIPRVYSLRELFKDLGTLIGRMPALMSIWIGGRLPRDLREKVIVAVAQVNACKMCEHAHTRMALEAGVSDAELAALENMDEEAFDRRSWLALAHARDRTQSGFAPITDVASRDALANEIGAQTTDDIEDVARVMTMANRVANTLNALSDRRRGQAIPGSRFVDELVINIMFLPGAWLGTLVAAGRQRKSPFAVWRQARGL